LSKRRTDQWDLGARCLTATTCEDPRMASLPHGEEPGDGQDIRLVVDTIPTLAWSAGPDGSADFFNQRWLDYTGLSAKQALGWGWEVAIHPADLPRILETFRDALNSVKPYEVEGRFRRFDGEFRWFLFRASPLCDDSGKVVKWYGTNTDIEDRKRAEDALRSHEQNLRLLVDTIPGHIVTTTPTGEIELLNRRVLEYFDKTPEELVNWRSSDAIHPDDLALTIAALTRAIQTGEPYEREHRLRRADGAYRWFHTRGLALRDKEGRIVRWYLLPIDVDDRRRAEEALRKSEERWRSVFENSAIGVALTDLNGRFLTTNHVFQAMVGYTEEELRAVSFADLAHEDYRQANWALVTELVEGKRRQFQIEEKYRRKDGSSIWVSNNVSLVPGTERVPRFIMALSEDITQRKRAEEKLRRSEADLLDAQRMSRTGSLKIDISSGTVTGSPQVFRIFGVMPGEDTSTPEFWLGRTHPDDQKRVRELFDRSITQKTDFDADYRIVLPDGAIKYLHSIGHPSLNESGNLVEFGGTIIDITERKQREEALRRSEGYLAEAQKLTHTGSWAAQVSQKEPVYWSNVYWSKEMYRIFGLDPGPTPPSPMEVVRQLHPEDAPYHPGVVERAIRDGTDFEMDFRLLLPDGAAKYIHVVGHPVVNASGDVIELVGTAMDVTEQHESRAALQAAFEQIKAERTELRRMTDAVAAFIYVLRPDGTALYANQTVLDYTGLTLEDLQREDQRARVFHPEDLERLREERQVAFARGKPFELEQRALGKNGNYRWFLARFNPLRDDQGNIIRWYATGTDIDDRKRAEERMRDENLALREQIDQAFMFEEIVGTSPGLQGVLSRVTKVAPTDSSVLISGETGTGKELVARAIHKRSRRSQRAFVSVNCAALAPSLIASELFGHEKGAFTGAMQRRLGRFELANGGTIFLDEIGEVPLDTQVALLRVLQEREFERVGGTQPVKIDVRIIAATNRDLEAAVANGTFRADLYYRLNVFPIQVPALRERQDDVLMLLEYFVHRFAQKMGKHFKKIDKRTVELFRSYPWPGNIRELQNVVERSVIVSSGAVFSVDAAWLSKDSRRVSLPQQPEPADANEDARRERQIIEDALAASRGRVSGANGAAARLRVSPSTLENRIKKLRIRKSHFKLS
jgi:PAS domain S-box-containing protein